jgi:perosamine synthetase
MQPAGGLPGAEAWFRQVVSLPIYPRLTDDQVDRVCDAVGDHLARARGSEVA